MTITVAGNKKEYEDGINLPTLIEKEQIDNAEYVTVTINDEFVEREKFPNRLTSIACRCIIGIIYNSNYIWRYGYACESKGHKRNDISK